MLASLINSAMHSVNLCEYANLISSISIDAFKCDLSPFDFLISDIRPYKGQINVSRSITENLKGSELENIKKDDIQDPYSFRCIPQVHGATKETLNYVLEIINTEINSVTDNPLIFVKLPFIPNFSFLCELEVKFPGGWVGWGGVGGLTVIIMQVLVPIGLNWY